MGRHGFWCMLFLGLGAVHLSERKGFNEKHLPPVAGTLYIASLAPFYPILSDVKSIFKETIARLYLTLNNSYSLGLGPPHIMCKVGPCFIYMQTP